MPRQRPCYCWSPAMGSVLSWNKPAKLSRPPSSLANDGELPTDMLYEVLLRLPADELCRLRLVCRSWRSLTSDPGFANAHASRHPLVACIHDDDGRALEVRFIDLSTNIVVKRVPLDHRSFDLAAQLDLLCLTPFSGKEQCSILNPVTSDEVTTLLPGGTCGFGRGACIFGYVPSTKEYKVLRIHTHATRNGDETTVHLKQTCDVMTLLGDNGVGMGTWRARPCPPVLVSPQSGQRVVVSGVAYFLLSRLDIDSDLTEFKPDTIALFDMATEEWRQETLCGPIDSDVVTAIDKKLMFDLHYNNLELAVLDTCLVLVQHGFRDCSIDLWFLVDMDVDKGLWSKRCSAWYAPGFQHEHNVFSRPYPLVRLQDGKLVMWVGGKQQVLRAYDPRTRTWDDLTKLENCFAFNTYTGNLLCSSQVCSES